MGQLQVGAGLLPVLGSAFGIIQNADRTFRAAQNLLGVNTAAGRSAEDVRAQQDLALEQLQQKQTADLELTQRENDLERERLAVQGQEEERKRRDALRRAVSRQRAQFGAQGISGSGGSSDAVLLGLFDESDEEREERERLDTLREGALDLELSSTRRLNLLQATQLAERQRLERSFL